MRSAKHLTHLLLALLVLLFAVPPSSPVQAASRKLSELNAPGGKVYKLLPTPDGSRVVYTAGYDRLKNTSGFPEDGLKELYSAPTTGGGPTLRLSSPLTETGEVIDFQLTPDGSRVIFIYESFSTELDQLYSVPVNGGAPILIYNPPLIVGDPGDEFQFTISPDSARVVFAYRPQIGGQKLLYSTSVLGGSVTPLSEYANITFGRGRLYVDITPDSSTVIYSIDQTAIGSRLYRIAITGGQATELSTGLTDNEDVSDFTLSPNGQHVIYQVYGSNGTSRTRIAPTAGGTNRNLIDRVEPTFFTPDSQTIVYEYPLNTTKSLAKVPVSGGTPITLTEALSPFYDTQLDPTGNYAVSAIAATGTYTLVSVSLNNGTVTPLSIGFPSLSNFSRIISPDGSRVVYLGGNGVNQPKGLYSVAINGGVATRLDDPNITAGGVFDLKLSPDGSRVVYTARITNSVSLANIYSVPINDGDPVRLSTPLEPDVKSVTILGVGALDRVFYSTTVQIVASGPGTTVTNKIYATSVAGSSTPVLIERSRITLSDVTDYQLTTDGNYAIYRADATIDEQFELFSIALPGGITLKLSGTGPVDTFKLSSNNDRVLFIENGSLYSAALDAGNPTLIYEPPQNSDIREYDFAAGQAVFRVRANTGSSELYRASLTSGATVLIDDEVASFRPAGTTRVVYQATLDNGFNALLSTTLGAAPSTEVYSNSLAILSYQVSPNGAHVVYQVEGFPLVSPNTLYSAPVEGGTATEIFSATNNVTLRSYSISPTSQHILYTTQPGPVRQLSSVPISGGASVPLVETDTDVEIDYEMSPSGSQVVYQLSPSRIGSSSFDNITLASIPIEGGTTTTLFSRDDEASVLIPFAITKDSARVAFILEGELYSVAITSTTLLKLVSAQNNARVTSFMLSPDSTKVAYTQAGALATIPINGGAPTTFVQPTIPSTAVIDYQFIDGEFLLYRGDLLKKGVIDLFIADASTATPAFTSTTLATSENAGPLAIPLRLSTTSQLPLSFTLRQVGGTAVAGSDYSLPNATITFPAGTTEQTLNLNLLDPPGYQGERTLVLGLFPAGTALTQSEPLATLTITITDNEAATRYVYLPMLKK